MHVGVLGINHKSSPLSLQEKVAKACQLKLSLEEKICEELSCVVLCTCNRSEIYFTSSDLAEAHSGILSLFREVIDEPFEHCLYTYFGVDCFAHLATVISGWDSLVIGETQIHRQVKMAYENAKLYYPLDSVIHYLFQKSLKIAKSIRSSLPHHFLSLPEILWMLLEEKLERIHERKILLVGNSEMNRKILAFLSQKKVRALTLSTRAPFSARDLEKAYGITILHSAEQILFNPYDLVICSTHAVHYLIRPTEQPFKTQLIIDLSVPRVVDPAMKKHLDLWDMEDIGRLIGREIHGDPLITDRIWSQVHQYTQLFREKQVYSCALSSY